MYNMAVTTSNRQSWSSEKFCSSKKSNLNHDQFHNEKNLIYLITLSINFPNHRKKKNFVTV